MAIWQHALGIDLDIPGDFGYWFAGFVDGDGSFNITLTAGCTLKIALRNDDRAILHQIRDTLGVGGIGDQSMESHRRKGMRNAHDMVCWTVSHRGSHMHVIVPLLEEFPLRTRKRHDFALWSQAVRIVHAHAYGARNQRATQRWHGEMLELKHKMEMGRKQRHSADRKIDDAGYSSTELGMSDSFGSWLSGFMDAEGTFGIVLKGKSCVSCQMGIGLHCCEESLLWQIKNRVGVGNVTPFYPGSVASWRVGSIKDHMEVTVPLFEKYPLRAKKKNDFAIWAQAVRLVHAKEHLTESGRQEILRLKQELDKGKKYQRLQTQPIESIDN